MLAFFVLVVIGISIYASEIIGVLPGLVSTDDEFSGEDKKQEVPIGYYSEDVNKIKDKPEPSEGPGESDLIEVKVYFASNKDTPDCARVEEFTRTILYTQAVGTAAINEMLKGPTMKEGEVAVNAIPQGTKLLILFIENGTAYAEFSKELQNYGGGSCNALAIRAQIENTLKQFPTVDRVEISVPGVVNPLQP